MKITVSAPESTITAELSYDDVSRVIHATKVLGDELCAAYIRYRDQGNPPGIILQLVTPVGSAGVVRGIYQLYPLVRAAQGRLTLRGFPLHYIDEVRALGLTALRDFILDTWTWPTPAKLGPSSCQDRGYHRIPTLDLVCIECNAELTPEEVIANERRKMGLASPDTVTE